MRFVFIRNLKCRVARGKRPACRCSNIVYSHQMFNYAISAQSVIGKWVKISLKDLFAPNVLTYLLVKLNKKIVTCKKDLKYYLHKK